MTSTSEAISILKLVAFHSAVPTEVDFYLYYEHEHNSKISHVLRICAHFCLLTYCLCFVTSDMAVCTSPLKTCGPVDRF
jgi:hypothetical protein